MDSLLPTILKKVWDELGSGYKEHIYQRAIEIEFQNEHIIFHSEVICAVNYHGVQIGFERADIVTYEDGKPFSILELKSQINSVSKKEFIQISKYFAALDVKEGYIINFIITPDIFLHQEHNKYKYIELFKITTGDNINIIKYSFVNNMYKEYKI
jgi:GxxExxY protein